MEDTGAQIGEKIIILLSEEQRKELVRYILRESDILNCVEVSYPHPFVHNKLMPDIEETLTEINYGDLYFCLEQRLVRVRDKIIKLTVKEFDLLTLLIMHPKRVFTYEMIMDLVWHEDYTFYSRKAVNNHVSNLRKKLRIAPDISDYIKSVYGVGYKFEV